MTTVTNTKVAKKKRSFKKFFRGKFTATSKSIFTFEVKFKTEKSITGDDHKMWKLFSRKTTWKKNRVGFLITQNSVPLMKPNVFSLKNSFSSLFWVFRSFEDRSNTADDDDCRVLELKLSQTGGWRRSSMRESLVKIAGSTIDCQLDDQLTYRSKQIPV